MPFEITTTGISVQTAPEILDELVADLKGIDGMADVPTDAYSAWGQILNILAEREAYNQLTAKNMFLAAFRETSTGISLNHAVALVAKSREEEAKSTVTLTLYNQSETSPVTVPVENQFRQPATGVVWETTEEVEIPALTTLHSSLDIDTLAWQSGTTVRATFNGTPDLSDVAVGDTITITGSSNSNNDGEDMVISAISTGSYYVEYANENVTDNTDDEASDATGTADIVDTETSVTVSAQSYEAGAFEASAGSITGIVNAVTGLDAVTNIGAATVGQEEETDSELKIRAATELVNANGGTLEAVKAKISDVSGVTYVYGDENDTDATVDGLKPHSYYFVVVGGTDQAIIDAIGTYKAPLQTNGSTTGTWTDSSGNGHIISFDRVTEVNPYFIVNLTTDANYPADGDTLVKAALDGVTYTHGEDIINFALVAAIYNAGIPGISTVEVLQGLTDPPSASTNISIPDTQVVNITTDRITVNS